MFRKKFHLFIPLLVIFLYFVPYFIFGENSPIQIHDNLDSNLVWIKMLLDNNALYAGPNTMIDQVFDGLPRYTLLPDYRIGLILFQLFGAYWGLICNMLVMSLTAFFGMNLLMKTHILKNKDAIYINAFVALIYSLLPFWSFTLNVAGLPLVFYVLLNFRNGLNRRSDWILLVFFAFYSSLVLIGIFVLFIFSIILLRDYLKKKDKVSIKSLFIALSVLFILYLINYSALIYHMIFAPDFISHRTEIEIAKKTFSASFEMMDMIFRYGQYHAHSLHLYIIIPLFMALFLKMPESRKKIYYFSFLFIALTSIFFGIISWQGVAHIYASIQSILPIQLQRFHFMHPMLWYILTGMALYTIAGISKALKISVYILLFGQLIYVMSSSPFYTREESPLAEFLHPKCYDENGEVIKKKAKKIPPPINGWERNEYYMGIRRNNLRPYQFQTESKAPNFRDFYSEQLFQKIHADIGLKAPSYRIICVGLHPAVPQYNGFYTLDGYFPNYPLSYKHEFRNIIAAELDKNPSMKWYFDKWGSRCYALTAELGIHFRYPKNKGVARLEFNFQALKKMGGKFILSTAPLNTVLDYQLRLKNIYNKEEYYYTIYLYELISEK